MNSCVPKMLNPIRTYRNDRQISALELAQAIGLSRSQLLSVETGQALLSEAQRNALAARLQVDPAEFDYAVDVSRR